MTALSRAIARPTPVAGFGERSPLHGLERRRIGIVDLAAQSVAAVAPAAAATTVVLLVAGVAPGMTVAAIVAAAVLSLAVARTVAQFARRFAAAGGVYTYAARGLGTRAGLGAGAAIVTGYAAVAMFALVGGAYYATYLLAGLWPGLNRPLAAAGAIFVQTAIVAFVLVRGIHVSARVALVVEALSVALIVVLLTVLLVHVGPIDIQVVFAVPTTGGEILAMAAGAVIAVTAFVGFESATTLGVEAVSPLRNVPRAITGTVIISGALYVLAAVTQVAGFDALGADLAASASPVNDLATAHGLGGWAVVADVGIAASFVACAIGSTTALVRVLFALSRDGVLPARIGRTHPRFGTPATAVAVALPVIAVIPVLLIGGGADMRDAMHVTLSVGAAGYIVAYILVCVAAPVFLHRIGESTLGPTVVSALAAAALTAALVAFFIDDTASGGSSLAVVGALAVVLVGVVIVLRRRHGPGSIGAYDEPIAAQVLGGVPSPRPPHDG
ncbi:MULTISPECIES: APC family permease [Microbacterium]|uniref:APC family permease n=1 Tax=Microbacterium TaxID=33882 RepID=UPI002782AD46|nr:MULTISPECIES: APC family permease [Microbacterium]MDQ1084774.1 amino acid transporter [Microbacterium sp. SORGH_AS_0344]MDQ1169947.1 amino acid transporter [Microbacterium proteolyticum]